MCQFVNRSNLEFPSSQSLDGERFSAMRCGTFHQELATVLGLLSKSAIETAACPLRFRLIGNPKLERLGSDTLLGNAEAGKK